MKRLHKSRREKLIGGVLGGVAEYFEIDPTIIRLLYVFLAAITVVIPFVVIYIVAYFIMPSTNY